MPWIEKAGPGATRVAALMLSLGQDLAADLFRRLGELEVRQVALGARDLKRQGTIAMPEALNTFISISQILFNIGHLKDYFEWVVCVTQIN